MGPSFHFFSASSSVCWVELLSCRKLLLTAQVSQVYQYHCLEIASEAISATLLFNSLIVHRRRRPSTRLSFCIQCSSIAGFTQEGTRPCQSAIGFGRDHIISDVHTHYRIYEHVLRYVGVVQHSMTGVLLLCEAMVLTRLEEWHSSPRTDFKDRTGTISVEGEWYPMTHIIC